MRMNRPSRCAIIILSIVQINVWYVPGVQAWQRQLEMGLPIGNVLEFMDYFGISIWSFLLNLCAFSGGILSVGIAFQRHPSLRLRWVAVAMLLAPLSFVLIWTLVRIVIFESDFSFVWDSTSYLAFIAVHIFPPLALSFLLIRIRMPNLGPICGTCGYDLRGSLDQPTCPECGVSLRGTDST